MKTAMVGLILGFYGAVGLSAMATAQAQTAIGLPAGPGAAVVNAKNSGGNSACPTPNNVAGAELRPGGDFSCVLYAGYGGGNGTPWQFINDGANKGPNYTLKQGGSTYGIAQASLAKLCTPPAPPANGSIRYGYYSPYVTTQITGKPTTYVSYSVSYLVTLQATGLCQPMLGYFRDLTQKYTWDTAQQAVDSAHAKPGDVLEFKAPPAGIQFGQNGNPMATADIQVPNLTIKLDAGFYETRVSAPSPPGHDPFNIQASGISIIGAGSARVTLSNHFGGGNDSIGQIDVLPGAQNITLQGFTASGADQNLNFGGNNGALTITDVVVDNGGTQGAAGNFGQQHNTYCSNSGQSGNSGPVKITAFQSYDVHTGGYLFKCRLDNVTMSASYLGCKSAPPTCQMNTPIDVACAGNFTVEGSVLERNLTVEDAQGNAPAMIRYGEEVGPASGNCSQAFGAGYPSNKLTLVDDIFLNDAPSWSGYPQRWAPVAMGCNWRGGTAMSCSCVIKNSVIIDNAKAGPYGGLNIQGSGGANSGNCQDGGGNVYFKDRLAAAQALGWIGQTDRWRNKCTIANRCAFPFQPKAMVVGFVPPAAGKTREN